MIIQQIPFVASGLNMKEQQYFIYLRSFQMMQPAQTRGSYKTEFPFKKMYPTIKANGLVECCSVRKNHSVF